jgi:hypothetical protein
MCPMNLPGAVGAFHKSTDIFFKIRQAVLTSILFIPDILKTVSSPWNVEERHPFHS